MSFLLSFTVVLFSSESPVSETVQGTEPPSVNTLDFNQTVNPSELLSELAKAVAKSAKPMMTFDTNLGVF